ncbi:MAG: hypothetical protein HY233_03490 [Acidobacteriales bacterium]|nr:hypothetical protein [Terriglobales bacterium]
MVKHACYYWLLLAENPLTRRLFGSMLLAPTAKGNPTGQSKESGTRTIEGTGKTLLPGLIDSHTHTFSQAQLKQALIFGVTTHLDMFTPDLKFAAQMKQERSSDRAELFSAGTLITAPEGKGTERNS